MATQPQRQTVQNRGLLTEDDREFFLGEKDTSDPDKTRREKRHNVRERIKNITEDLEILADANETDLVNEFHGETDRNSKIETELSELRKQLGMADDTEE